jgi:hypothetical protein
LGFVPQPNLVSLSIPCLASKVSGSVMKLSPT